MVAISAGAVASSGALVAFGLDSVIEAASAAAVAWQFSARSPETVERREQRALRIIAVSFFALAAYVSVDAARTLLGGGETGHSMPGLVLAALSLAVMPFLSFAQRRALDRPVRPPARAARAGRSAPAADAAAEDEVLVSAIVTLPRLWPRPHGKPIPPASLTGGLRELARHLASGRQRWTAENPRGFTVLFDRLERVKPAETSFDSDRVATAKAGGLLRAYNNAGATFQSPMTS
ncbi:hypothetical protein [Spirillospora sp. CA-128828]|uniref:hypothetical protein n=1 Tax=Spirillospora sp. CA-128828 TaxID=3240033 RepID=UPI003D93DBF7